MAHWRKEMNPPVEGGPMTYITSRLTLSRPTFPGKLARWRAVPNESRAMKALRRAKARYLAS